METSRLIITNGNHPGMLSSIHRSSSSSTSDCSPTEIHPVVHTGKNKKRKKVKGERIIIKSFSGTKFSSIHPSGSEFISLQSPPPSTRGQFLTNDLGHTGSQTFPNRTDFSAFKKMLPRYLVNSFHIKVEDEYYSGRDEIKAFILSTFAKLKSSNTRCILCKHELTVFNRYPMIDGTFFLSPLKHDDFCCGLSIASVRMMVGYTYQAMYEASNGEYRSGAGEVYLCAVCVKCMSGVNAVSCSFCGCPWQADIHQLGTLYKYDLLSASQCCVQRRLCTTCSQPVINANEPMFFSTPSEVIQCPHCQTIDYHLLRPSLTYTVIPETYSRHY